MTRILWALGGTPQQPGTHLHLATAVPAISTRNPFGQPSSTISNSSVFVPATKPLLISNAVSGESPPAVRPRLTPLRRTAEPLLSAPQRPVIFAVAGSKPARLK